MTDFFDDPDIAALRARLSEICDIEAASALLSWDQATYMPEGGAAARGRQLAILRRIAHERMIAPELGNLIAKAERRADGFSPDSDASCLVRVARRNFERAVKIPPEFAADFSAHVSATYEAWVRARREGGFATLAPMLEKTLDFSRRYSEFFPGYGHIADPLIDMNDEGMTVAVLRPLFAELRRGLVPLVRAVAPAHREGRRLPPGRYDPAVQLKFGEEVIKTFGYDFRRGRQDKTHHPFMIKFSLGDVRITTRFKEDDVTDALFSTMHEAGHALYEQGFSACFEGTPLAHGASTGVHESQSRLWENLVGRSLPFWEYFYPRLQKAFPDPLARVSLEAFYRAVNRVAHSLIRTDADELTYNLHVMIRFDLEQALLEGRLKLKDLPEAWNERYRQDLGAAPANDAEGVLQDVHWYADFIGGQFQGYAIGNILAAQFFAAARRDRPGIPDELRRGECGLLRGWLTETLYRNGRKFPPDETVRRATGTPIRLEPYFEYLRGKYPGA